MLTTTENREFFKEIFREVIVEVMNEERIGFYNSIFPMASNDEIQEIEEHYGSPDNYSKEDFEDMTDWVFDDNKIS